MHWLVLYSLSSFTSEQEEMSGFEPDILLATVRSHTKGFQAST